MQRESMGWTRNRRAEKSAREPEQALYVLCRPATDSFDREALDLGDRLRDVADVGRFVAPASMRDGGEVRAVGLEKDSLERDRSNSLLKGHVLWERERPTNAKMKSQFAKGLREGYVAEEGVDHAPVGGPVRPQDGEKVIGRLAIVNRDRQIESGSHLELVGENTPLYRAGREVAVVVKTDLANGDRMLGKYLDLAKHERIHSLGVMRMYTDRRPDPAVSLRQSNRLPTRSKIRTDGDNADRFAERTRDDRRPIACERPIVQMGVGIDQLQLQDSTSRRTVGKRSMRSEGVSDRSA